MTSAGWRHAARLLAAVILCGLLLLALGRLDLARALRELATVQIPWLALAIACYLLILPLWAMQWRILAPPGDERTTGRMLGVVAMTSSVLNTTALLVGEAAGVFFLVARTGLERSAALSVLAMDQLLVGLAKLTVLGAAALAAPLPLWMARGVAGLIAGVTTLVLVLGVAAWRHADVAAHAGRVLPDRLASLLGEMSRALAPLREPQRAAAAFALALTKKLAEVSAILCVQHAFGVSLAPTSAVVVLAALNLATLLPIVPGNVGVYEGATVLTYAHYGVPAERALGIAVVQHACYFAALALPGYLWLLRERPARSPAAAP